MADYFMSGAPSYEIKDEPQSGAECEADAFMNVRAELLRFMKENTRKNIVCVLTSLSAYAIVKKVARPCRRQQVPENRHKYNRLPRKSDDEETFAFLSLEGFFIPASGIFGIKSKRR